MANNYTSASFIVEGVTTEGYEAILSYLERKESDPEWWSTGWIIEHNPDTSELWVSDDGGEMSIDAVVTVLQHWLLHHNPDGYIAFEAAFHCSKQRVGEFGGCAVFLTATKVESMGTWLWLGTKMKEFHNN